MVLDGELEPVKRPPDEIDNIDYNMVMMLAGDNGPHREMAVDVPDTFIARNKTPPRYPPPKPKLQVYLHYIMIINRATSLFTQEFCSHFLTKTHGKLSAQFSL